MPTKADRPKVPKFDSEAEEAKWWDDNPDIAEGELLKAMRDGTVRRGTAQQLARQSKTSKNITIRIPVDDIERARRLADRKGLGYQTYMKMLLHEALNREEPDTNAPPRKRRTG
jgi:predicted DNA binding CopG/RHH family protein